MIPTFMLKKLYISGSLKQEQEMIVFQLTNNLVTGTVTKVDRIQIDNQDYESEKITILWDDAKMIIASEISVEKPFILEKGKTFTFQMPGKLDPGKHTIAFSFDTKEAGKIAFNVDDEM